VNGAATVFRLGVLREEWWCLWGDHGDITGYADFCCIKNWEIMGSQWPEKMEMSEGIFF